MHFAQYFLLARDSYFGTWFFSTSDGPSRRCGILWFGRVNLSRYKEMDAKRFRTGLCSQSGLKRPKLDQISELFNFVSTRTTREGKSMQSFQLSLRPGQSDTIPRQVVSALRRLPRGVWERNSPSLVVQLLTIIKAGSCTVLSQN